MAILLKNNKVLKKLRVGLLYCPADSGSYLIAYRQVVCNCTKAFDLM